MKTAIFDLDGTLVDTSVDMIAAANVILGDDVLDPAHHAAIAFAGGRAMLREGSAMQGSAWSLETIDRVYHDFLKVYGASVCVGSTPFFGAREAVDVLVSKGWQVAVCTNKPEAMAEDLLQELNWRAAFGALIGADTLPKRKPDPAPVLEAMRRAGGIVEQSIMIGDTNGDILAATRAGLRSVLVRFGVEPLHPVTAVPNATCKTFDALPDLLDQMLCQ